MGKKQKPQVDPEVKAQQAQSLAAVRPPSVGESALTGEATGLLDWIHKGDYTQRPKNLFFNYADPAARQRKRELMMNAGAQGVAALGQGANPNLLALNKQNLQDEFARDTAGQYESDVSQAGLRAAGMLGDVAGLENARELGTLGATTGMYGQSLGANTQWGLRPRWWETLLSQAGQGAQAAATYGAAAGSDSRAKEDIKVVSSPLDKVAQIQGYQFVWDGSQFNPAGKHDVGVLAQEVERVLPELVTTNLNGYKMVNYNGLVGLLFAAVNELNAKLEAK